MFDLIRVSRVCRSFQSRQLTREHLTELMAFVSSQTTPGRYPYFGRSSIRLEYVSAPLTVWPVVGAKEFLVAIAPSEYRGESVIEVGYTLEKVVTQATRMGLATCWIGPGGDQASTKLRRLPLPALFFGDSSMSQPLKIDEAPFDRFGRSYEICQWSPSSFNGQTTRCVGLLNGDGELDRFDFHAVTSSHYYAAVALGIWCANWELGCQALSIEGEFRALTPQERGGPLICDVSWIPEQNLP